MPFDADLHIHCMYVMLWIGYVDLLKNSININKRVEFHLYFIMKMLLEFNQNNM